MRELDYDRDGILYTRISKRKARERVRYGLPTYALPCKLDPGNTFWPICTPYEVCADGRADFDTWCNAAEYYNCCYECGYYLAFYAPVIKLLDLPFYDTVEMRRGDVRGLGIVLEKSLDVNTTDFLMRNGCTLTTRQHRHAPEMIDTVVFIPYGHWVVAWWI